MATEVRKIMDRPMSVLFHQYLLEFIKYFGYFKNSFKEPLILSSSGYITIISDASTSFQQGVGLTDWDILATKSELCKAPRKRD
jgi:hypothetical protein